jgi:acetyltransferase
MNTTAPPEKYKVRNNIDSLKVREVVESCQDGFLLPHKVNHLLDASHIPRVEEITVSTLEEALMVNEKMSFPLVMKVVGPVHKSDVGGVQLNVKSNEEIKLHYERMMQIEGSIGVLFQPMSSGLELFAGIKKEGDFGHLIMCGLGGIFIEVLKDVSIGLVPLNRDESLKMIKSLRGYKLIEGVRGQSGVDENVFANILVQLSVLIEFAPEIIELDLNPLLGDGDRIIAVDARIRIEK